MKTNPNCPKDRKAVEESGLSQVRRYFKNLLANLAVRCEFCDAGTTHGELEGHKATCPQNPDLVECTFCNVKYLIKDEKVHKKSCIPFLHQKIAKNKRKKNELKRKIENYKKQMLHNYVEIEPVARRPRSSLYIFSWKATFPTNSSHSMETKNYYYTYKTASCKLEHGEMEVFLGLHKRTRNRSISLQFGLTNRKKARVSLKYSLSSSNKVLWQNERTEMLEIKTIEKRGWTELAWTEPMRDILPTGLPKFTLVVVEISEWEPTAE